MSKPHIPLNGTYPIIVIEYLGQTMRDLNLTDKHCESCKWHRTDSVGVDLVHECAISKTQILRPDTMTCPNWEEL